MKQLLIVCAVGLCVATAYAGNVTHTVDIEGGWVFPGYNDVRIPGDSGTKLSLTEDLVADSFPAFRFRYTATLSGKHDIGLLAAFLTMRSDGALDQPVDFNGATFTAGTPLESTFKFNSYRLTYRYLFYDSPKVQCRAGVAAKVRDAAIQLKGGGQDSEKTDLGFVPLLSFSVRWLAHPSLSVVMDGEALAAPQGRAEDVFIGVESQLNDNLSLKAGYRILEGGADNDKVYTFSLFHYIA
ncbi:MAG: hypothetical protein WCN95_11955, partial [bacterium]